MPYCRKSTLNTNNEWNEKKDVRQIGSCPSQPKFMIHKSGIAMETGMPS